MRETGTYRSDESYGSLFVGVVTTHASNYRLVDNNKQLIDKVIDNI